MSPPVGEATKADAFFCRTPIFSEAIVSISAIDIGEGSTGCAGEFSEALGLQVVGGNDSGFTPGIFNSLSCMWLSDVSLSMSKSSCPCGIDGGGAVWEVLFGSSSAINGFRSGSDPPTDEIKKLWE